MVGYSDDTRKGADETTRRRYEMARQDYDEKDLAHQDTDRRVRSLEAELQSLQEQLSESDHWEIRMRSALVLYSEAQGELIEPRQELASLQDQIQSLELEIHQLERDIQKHNEAVGKALTKTDLAAAKDAAAQCQKQLTDLEQLKGNLGNRLNKLRETIKIIQSRIDKAETAVWRAKLDGLKEEFLTRNQGLIEAMQAVSGKGKMASFTQSFLTSSVQLFKFHQPDQLKCLQDTIARDIGLTEANA
jgi:chromosome segregation ATPase